MQKRSRGKYRPDRQSKSIRSFIVSIPIGTQAESKCPRVNCSGENRVAVKYIISVWASGKVSSLAPPPGIRFAGQERTQIQQVRECYPSNGGGGKEHSPNEAGSQTARRQYGKGQNTERSPGGRKNSRRMQIEFADCKLAAEVSEGPNDAGR
nr:uncharacterized protein LOC115259776 [Aedes albopictus]